MNTMVDLTMAVRTNRSNEARIIGTTIAEPARMMRL
jgi:hypothetical protein